MIKSMTCLAHKAEGLLPQGTRGHWSLRNLHGKRANSNKAQTKNQQRTTRLQKNHKTHRRALNLNEVLGEGESWSSEGAVAGARAPEALPKVQDSAKEAPDRNFDGGASPQSYWTRTREGKCKKVMKNGYWVNIAKRDEERLGHTCPGEQEIRVKGRWMSE